MTPRNGHLALVVGSLVAMGSLGAAMLMFDTRPHATPAEAKLADASTNDASPATPQPAVTPPAAPADANAAPAPSASPPAGALSLAPAASAKAAPPPATDSALVIKRILPITGAIKYGEWHWDETNVPPGPIVVTVDLQARVLSAWRGGYEIGTAAVLVGAPAKPTPTGVFPITQKQVKHFSSLYNAAPMPYMQRLTGDGVTLHASDHVRNGYASHGCVSMPLAFAKKLYGVTRLGDKVIITNGKHAQMGDALTRS